VASAPELTAPRAVGHVGITVPDIEAAVAWYGELFGFRLIGPIADVDQSEGGAFAGPVADIFGPELQRMRMAFLSSANACIIELFEFQDAPCAELDDHFDYQRRGLTHLAITDPDVAGTTERIVARGGRQRSEVWTLFEGMPYQACYCEDPWGTVIELLSHSHEQTFANLG
jgi:catechol 2,3-dioxygenase-like lactoylglutathione lyase family enzyme